MDDFSGSRVLVTGAASGIGAACARLLAGRGAALVLVDRDFDGLAAFPQAERVIGDVSDPALWRDLPLDGLTHAVVNAGVARGGASIVDTPWEEWRAILSTNLDGGFLTLGAAMRAFRAGGRGGAAVITASVAGIRASAGSAPYGVSKAALIHLAKAAAIEGAPDRIRVNAVAPAGVETPIWTGQAFFQDLADKLGGEAAAFRSLAEQSTRLGRFATPEEVAVQIAFLLSEQAAQVTGACLVADGGYSL